MSTASSHETTGLDELLPVRDTLTGHDGSEVVRSHHDKDDVVTGEVDFDVHNNETANDYSAYRTLSAAAVVSCALGAGSFLAFFDWWLVVVPLAGVALGVFALRQIAARSDELTGRVPATIGLVLSAVGILGGQAKLWYDRITELPPGHVRISYSDLQPPERSLVPVPDSARALDGKRVLIKGYVLAGNRKDGIRTFILVRDKGDCCFGGNPKLTDRVLVQLKPGHVFSYTDRMQKLAGLFHIRPGQAVDVAGDVIYQLEDAELR